MSFVSLPFNQSEDQVHKSHDVLFTPVKIDFLIHSRFRYKSENIDSQPPTITELDYNFINALNDIYVFLSYVISIQKVNAKSACIITRKVLRYAYQQENKVSYLMLLCYTKPSIPFCRANSGKLSSSYSSFSSSFYSSFSSSSFFTSLLLLFLPLFFFSLLLLLSLLCFFFFFFF